MTKKETTQKEHSKLKGLANLVIALAETATVYVFATQDNPILWVLAGVLGLDAAYKYTVAFIYK